MEYFVKSNGTIPFRNKTIVEEKIRRLEKQLQWHRDWKELLETSHDVVLTGTYANVNGTCSA